MSNRSSDQLQGESLAWYCIKHGTYSSTSREVCPKCKAVSEKGLCVDCEAHKATVQFSSALDMVHGFAANICQCCYFKRVEKAWKEINENYLKLKEQQGICR